LVNVENDADNLRAKMNEMKNESETMVKKLMQEAESEAKKMNVLLKENENKYLKEKKSWKIKCLN